jgi:hypothetical protein
MSDLFIRNEGKIFLLIPGNKKGRTWIDKNVEIEGKIQFQNEPIVIEHCHIGTIINGAQAAGLKVSVVAP